VVISALHLLLVLATLVGLLDAWTWGPTLTLAALIMLFWSTGHFQADVALNPALDEFDRRRWRVALWCLLWSMTLYWQLHVRSRRAFD
jgi:hypothetical protein